MISEINMITGLGETKMMNSVIGNATRVTVYLDPLHFEIIGVFY